MITDMLEQMNRRQLESTAKELKIPASRYPTKVKLVAAIRKKRAKL
jgi:hypothetical protein